MLVVTPEDRERERLRRLKNQRQARWRKKMGIDPPGPKSKEARFPLPASVVYEADRP